MSLKNCLTVFAILALLNSSTALKCYKCQYTGPLSTNACAVPKVEDCVKQEDVCITYSEQGNLNPTPAREQLG